MANYADWSRCCSTERIARLPSSAPRGNTEGSTDHRGEWIETPGSPIWPASPTGSEPWTSSERAALVIANNSGVAHLAASCGTPTLAVYSGSHQPQEWGPRGNNVRAVMALGALLALRFRQARGMPERPSMHSADRAGNDCRSGPRNAVGHIQPSFTQQIGVAVTARSPVQRASGLADVSAFGCLRLEAHDRLLLEESPQGFRLFLGLGLQALPVTRALSSGASRAFSIIRARKFGLLIQHPQCHVMPFSTPSDWASSGSVARQRCPTWQPNSGTPFSSFTLSAPPHSGQLNVIGRPKSSISIAPGAPSRASATTGTAPVERRTSNAGISAGRATK